MDSNIPSFWLDPKGSKSQGYESLRAQKIGMVHQTQRKQSKSGPLIFSPRSDNKWCQSVAENILQLRRGISCEVLYIAGLRRTGLPANRIERKQFPRTDSRPKFFNVFPFSLIKIRKYMIL
jgi:hypothetical protein